jgi:hypothetical protein
MFDYIPEAEGGHWRIFMGKTSNSCYRPHGFFIPNRYGGYMGVLMVVSMAVFFLKGRCWWTIGIFGGPHFCYHTCTCGNHMWQHDLTIFDILTTSWLIKNTWGSNKRLFLLTLWYPAIPMPNNWLLFILCARFRWWHPNIELVRILFVGCKSLLLPHRII